MGDEKMNDLPDALYKRGLLAKPVQAREVSLTLEKYLTSRNAHVRYGAVMGMSYVGTKANIPALEEAWDREDDGIVRSLMQALITWLRGRP